MERNKLTHESELSRDDKAFVQRLLNMMQVETQVGGLNVINSDTQPTKEPEETDERALPVEKEHEWWQDAGAE